MPDNLPGSLEPSANPAGNSVRVATADDAPVVGALQATIWRSGLADLLPAEVIDAFDEAAFARAWTRSLATPPSLSHRLLVAQDDTDPPTVVGLAALAPSTDPDLAEPDVTDEPSALEILTFGVGPHSRGRGHGSRLLQACVDIATGQGADLLVIWVWLDDADTRRFLQGAGFGPDRAWRERVVDPDGGTRREVRLVTSLRPPDQPDGTH